MAPTQLPSWQYVAAQKQKEINDLIPSEWRVNPSLLQGHNFISLPYTSGIMTKTELQITESSAIEILAAIHTRRYSSYQVTLAFCKRSAIAHQATNCLALPLYKSALFRAKELDTYMATHNKPIGPLHGLPISVKEHIHLLNTPATSGIISWSNNSSPNDALICQIFEQAGAVFHVKTTNPQTLMSLETESNLFGRTSNPHNTSLTSGGSSGGESALIAMKGSCLGIGTDIGGSIRNPSGFCGGYGLKASVARIPHSGLSGLHSGMENIIGCVGPMANDLQDLKLFCQVALAAEPWDHEPSLINLPWQSCTPDMLPKKLKIGVMWHDGIVTPHPPVTRALEQTVKALEAAGHEIMTWTPEYHQDLIDWINKAYFLDGGDEYRKILEKENDPPVPSIQWLLDSHATKRHSVEETWVSNMLRDKLRTAWMTQWRQKGIHTVLCPVGPSVASRHGESRYWGYTSVFNALDLPGVVFPVSKVMENDTWDDEAKTKSFGDKDEMYKRFWDQGGAEKYKDAPVNLQLVGRRLREEELLAAAEVVVDVLKSSGNGVETNTSGQEKKKIMVQSRL